MTEDKDIQAHNSAFFPGETDRSATCVLRALSRYARRDSDRFDQPVCSSDSAGFHVSRCSQSEDLVLNPTGQSQYRLASEVYESPDGIGV